MIFGLKDPKLQEFFIASSFSDDIKDDSGGRSCALSVCSAVGAGLLECWIVLFTRSFPRYEISVIGPSPKIRVVLCLNHKSGLST